MHSVPEHEAVVLNGVHAAPQQERYGKSAYMHSIQGKMRKRAIVVIRQPTIPVTDRYRLFLMRLGARPAANRLRHHLRTGGAAKGIVNLKVGLRSSFESMRYLAYANNHSVFAI